MGTSPKRVVAKPRLATRPGITHGGVKVDIPLLSGTVGPVPVELRAKFPVSGAPADSLIVEYYLSHVADIKFSPFPAHRC